MPKILAISHSTILEVNRILYHYLAEKNIQVKIIAPDNWPSGGLNKDYCNQENSNPKLEIIESKTFFKGNGSLYFLKLNLTKVLMSFEPEFIFLDEEPWSLIAYQTLKALKNFPNIKLIFYTKQNIFKKYPFPFSHIEKKVYSRAILALSISEDATKVLRKKGFQKKIICFPHAVEIKQFFPNHESRSTTFLIGYIGRFVEEKGAGDLIEAVGILKNKGLAIDLILVGGGVLRDKWQNRINQLKLEKCIKIEKSVEHKGIQNIYHRLHLFCLPSKTTKNWKEQFGRVLIEAAACKIAQIGSNSGEIPKVINSLQSGLIFEEGNIQDLADKIELIYNDTTLREQFENNGYANALNKYSYQKITDLFIEVIKE